MERAYYRNPGHRRKRACSIEFEETKPQLKLLLPKVEAAGHCVKQGRSSSKSGRMQQAFTAIRAKSEVIGYLELWTLAKRAFILLILQIIQTIGGSVMNYKLIIIFSLIMSLAGCGSIEPRINVPEGSSAAPEFVVKVKNGAMDTFRGVELAFKLTHPNGGILLEGELDESELT
ncbi:MAG: hypothetical protein ACC641_11780, partial [Acidiferrobacterales bacterium]